MSLGTIGGILLITGAYFVYRGEIYKSMYMYLAADVVWISLSILSGDIIGALFVFVGATLGTLAFIKMNKGTFNKTIHKK